MYELLVFFTARCTHRVNTRKLRENTDGTCPLRADRRRRDDRGAERGLPRGLAVATLLCYGSNYSLRSSDSWHEKETAKDLTARLGCSKQSLNHIIFMWLTAIIYTFIHGSSIEKFTE